MQFELTLNFDCPVYLHNCPTEKLNQAKKMLCSMSIMMLTGCWCLTGMPTQNEVVTVGNKETMPLLPDFLLGGIHEAERVSDKRD